MHAKKLTPGLLLLILIFLTGSTAFSQVDPEEEPVPNVNIRFLYVMCNDVGSMRTFYTDLLGMDEFAYYNEDDFQYLCYDSEGFQFMFFGAVDGPLDVIDEWTWQPGWGGDVDGISWSIEYDQDMFIELVDAIRFSDPEQIGIEIPLLDEKPLWRQGSYWGYTVRDPMGNTVELYTVPDDDYEYPADDELIDGIEAWDLYALRVEMLNTY